MTIAFDGGQLNLVDLYDGADAVVVVYAPTHTPVTTDTTVADVADEVGRVDVVLSATLVDGNVLVSFDDAEVDIDGADVVGGWVVAQDGATDADRRLLAGFDDPGGFPPDPYPIVLTNYALRYKRPA